MPVPSVRESLHLALAHHRGGRPRDAEMLYRQILDADPDQPDALHFLGVLALQEGDGAAADHLIAHALSVSPANPSALSNHGVALRCLGRYDEALARSNQALAIKPDHVDALYNRGVLLGEMGRYDDALISYDRVLVVNPDQVDALYNRGNALVALGRPEEAEANYRQVLELKPDHADALYNLAQIARRRGDLQPAVRCYLRAIEVVPTHILSWVGIARCLGQIDTLDERWTPLVLATLRNKNIDPQDVERAAVGLLANDPALRELLDAAGDPEALSFRMETLWTSGRLTPLLNAPILQAVLDECIITTFPLEVVLTAMRRWLLARAYENPDSVGDLGRFASSLALQCFANGYVYAEAESERSAVDALLARVRAGVMNKSPCPSLWVKLIAAYRPLHRLDVGDDVAGICAAELNDDLALSELMRRQVTEPREEARIKDEIPRLTDSDDQVSVSVRRQYEESPYPRWRRGGYGEGKPIHSALRELFPTQAIADSSPRNPDALVAGCGTGRHPIQIAHRFSGAKILAVDLSLTSLAYAKRATAAIGIAGIDYAQADILKLGTLERRFDLIDSSGVLHHMGDPFAGWTILRGLLRPGGYMKIGLYSGRARRHLSALRGFIAERGYSATAEGIRTARQAIMAGDERKLLQKFDCVGFYSMSACRDLLFHVQEHVFTPLDIKSALDRLDLKFLGFEFRNPTHERAYRARFPDDDACDSLENWEAFEEEHPDTFVGMHQFWCVAG